ncbi:glycosyl hydrolase family 2 protein [Hymenobacter tenuis]
MRTLAQSLALAVSALLLAGPAAAQTSPAAPDVAHWFPRFEFDAAAFRQPAVEFAPFARWWWPGNDVTTEELQREVNLLADHAFGGVEIQPFALLPINGKEQIGRVMSWDSPSYYANVRTVLEAARKRGLTVDITDGSGWPAGGPHLTAEDNLLTLRYASLDVTGGRALHLAVPRASTEPTKLPVFGTTFYSKVDPSLSKLQAVVATKVLGQQGEQTQLDPNSTLDLNGQVLNGQLDWQAPAGNWRILAFWAMPSGEKPGIIATNPAGFVFDHFDSTKVRKNYEWLFGERNGLAPYYGNPLRAVFNDSYEFKSERHYSHDFLRVFRQQRGYDPVPWLAANLHPGYNNQYYRMSKPDTKTDFTFTDQDWRLLYDYDLTLSDLLQANFLKFSKRWLERRGLLHSTQAYGIHMDRIAAAGLASVPETEQLEGGNYEGMMKVVSSGAHLYNRPITAAEAFVYIERAWMSTPQKLKISADKAFAAGVNQLIYHGIAYRYKTEKLPPEGWSPFSLSIYGTNFSDNFNESNAFWADLKPLNQYLQRTQYALRAGKPHADVLVYLPFLDLDEMTSNPEEILTHGYLPGVEASLPSNQPTRKGPMAEWSRQLWPLLNQLEAAGLTWEWVNDASLQAATTAQNGQFSIRGNTYQALLLAHVPYMQLPTAQRLRELGQGGARLLAVGELPGKQPGFLKYAARDRQTQQLVEAAFTGPGATRLTNAGGLAGWLTQLTQPVRFSGSYPFLRQQQRDMADGSQVKFIWNKSDQWQPITLALDARFSSSYWLNAADGSLTVNKGNQVSYVLPPYGSILLYANTAKPVASNLVTKKAALTSYQGQPVAQLPNWNIKVGAVSLTDSPLFDWKTSNQLKYASEPGVYTSSFTLPQKPGKSHYFLDLGKVYFTAEVRVNGQLAGKLLYAPYSLDITPLVRRGANQVEVRVTPTQLNGFIGKALQGNKLYSQFKTKGSTLMSEGLVGPVTVLKK